jgi:hypothetical protein
LAACPTVAAASLLRFAIRTRKHHLDDNCVPVEDPKHRLPTAHFPVDALGSEPLVRYASTDISQSERPFIS